MTSFISEYSEVVGLCTIQSSQQTQHQSVWPSAPAAEWLQVEGVLHSLGSLTLTLMQKWRML